VLNRIAQPGGPAQKHIIPTQLIKRESSGPLFRFAGRTLGLNDSSRTNA
jgi:hypothetical protein